MEKTRKFVNYDKQEIEVTKEFLMKAGQFGTPEFMEALNMQKKLPGFKLVERKIKRNPDKQSYGELTYKRMAAFIKNYETDDAKRDAVLEEFFAIQEWAKTQRSAAYAKVKKWFLDKYNEPFAEEARKELTEKAQREKAREEKRRAKLLEEKKADDDDLDYGDDDLDYSFDD